MSHMEFVESFKLTDIERVEKEGLDRKLLSERVANAFLRQIVETGYFHADPHRYVLSRRIYESCFTTTDYSLFSQWKSLR